jgi:hydroxymethylglutaryl-CoA lyase
MTQAPRIEWVEVGPRDGLQSWPDPVPTPVKVGLIEGLLECGMQRVEATSMVHPKRVPQLADAEAVLEALQDRLPRLRVLVPNARGMERALAAGTRNVAVNIAATESYNQHNLNSTVKETLAEIARVMDLARPAEIRVDASLSVAFGCPYQGEVPVRRVLEVGRALAELGIAEIALADTIGMAHPGRVEELFQTAHDEIGSVRWGAHFHDTRGMALANLLTALETGVSIFEGSIGGIGGSFAPGAAGNICSEDALYMLDAMGIETGVDLGKLIELARRMEKQLGSPLPGKIYKLPQPLAALAQP